MTQALWTPSPERINSTLLKGFIDHVDTTRQQKFADYDELWNWSVTEPGQFWRSLWDFCGIVGDPGERDIEASDKLLDVRYLPDATLNFAENLLNGKFSGPPIIFYTENDERVELSLEELKAQVSQLQQALKAQGVGPGDRVAGYIPNMPEAVAAMLAVTSLGGVWSSCSPDFGLNGLKDRFGQIEPKVLFCTDGYFYGGKTFPAINTAVELAKHVESIDKVVVIPFVDSNVDLSAYGDSVVSYSTFTDAFAAKDIEYTRVPFRHPLFILFSSGTTGLPKCIIHSVGGSMLQLIKEHQLQSDLQPGDRLLYFTTCGWMMWNWLIGALASGVTLVLYDGNPAYPDAYRLANIVEKEKVTHFGTSARFIDACSKQGVKPIDSHDFSSLRTVLSTGSPLSEEGFHYIYDAWKQDVCLSSIAGGTDIMGCFVGGNPIGPVYAGQCQKRQLGMNVRVFDDQGNPLEGEPGELVCIMAFPSMPVGFLNDPEGKRYHDAYFARFDNVWCHGDWVELKPEGGMVFHGRSDATLNPGGVRIGTAEIYRQLENVEEVLEGVVIGQNWDNDVRVVLFIKLREGAVLTEDLVKRIKTEIRVNASPRHVPARVIAVADIPRTLSGKITELAVRDVVHGKAVKNTEALANPESLEYFRDLAELNC